MKREEIRRGIFERKLDPPREVSFGDVKFFLKKATWAVQQEARKAGLSEDGTFNFDLWCLALLIETAIDADGKPVFVREDLASFQTIDGGEMQRVVNELMDVNGLTSEKKAEAVKGSAGTGGGADSSPSAETSAVSPQS